MGRHHLEYRSAECRRRRARGWRDERVLGATQAGPTEARRARTEDDTYTVDLRLGLAPEDDRWSFELWGRNLTDHRSSSVRFTLPLRDGATVPSSRNREPSA